MATGMKGAVIADDVAEEVTTLTVPKSLRERLETFRRHPRETVADILAYIMDRAEGKA